MYQNAILNYTLDNFIFRHADYYEIIFLILKNVFLLLRT